MNQIDNIKRFTSDMRFDVVGLTWGMKSVLTTAMFNIGTGGAIPVVAPKGTGVRSGVMASVLSVSWALTRMSLIFFTTAISY